MTRSRNRRRPSRDEVGGPSATEAPSIADGETNRPAPNNHGQLDDQRRQRRRNGGGRSARRSVHDKSASFLPERHKRRTARRLQDGMATALSLDHWSAPPSSKCHCEDSSDLSVNFLCMHPRNDTDDEEDHEEQDDDDRGRRPAPPNKRSAARFQEIFVDLCVLHAASFNAASRHVLDERFDSFLGEGERSFKRALLNLVKGEMLPPEARATSAFRRLERMLRSEMGLDGLDERQEQRVRKMQGLRRVSSLMDMSASSGGKENEDGENAKLEEACPEELRTSASADSLASSAVASDVSTGSSAGLDSQAVTLRDIISQIRSDDALLRRFALMHPNRDGPPPTVEELESVLLSALPAQSPPFDPHQVATWVLNSNPPPDLWKESNAFQSLLLPPGHVFVTNASVCDLFCDAFLCPCGIGKNDMLRGSIWGRWFRNMRKGNPRLLNHLRGISESDGKSEGEGSGRGKDNFVSIPMKRFSGYDRVATPKHWPWEEFRQSEQDEQMCMVPTPLLVAGEVSIEKSRLGEPHTNLCRRKGVDMYAPSEGDHLDALMETVRQFVSVSLDELRREQPRPRANRERYLLALPVVGTGGGHAGDLTGQIVEKMLRLLCEIVSLNDDVDCVLVCADVATFSHAQNCRWRMCEYLESGGGHWQPRREDAKKLLKLTFDEIELFPSFRLLSHKMRESAKQLAKLAARGHLSMFIGAGVSMGSGLPSWGQLLLGVEDQFTANGLPSQRMLADSADPLAAADWLGILAASRPDRIGRRRDLKQRIATLIEERSQNPSLLMSLLTSLPCKNFVTQNYDRLIERAFECHNVAERKLADVSNSGAQDDVVEKLSVIPHAPVRGADRWLLKMHGCTSCHESIIVTSDDYRNYDSGRQKALAGLVQANLMTNHFLFVGFSLSDPNYLRIIEEVRHALKPGQNAPTSD